MTPRLGYNILSALLVLSLGVAPPPTGAPGATPTFAATLRPDAIESAGLEQELRTALTTGLEEDSKELPIRVATPDGAVDWRTMGWPVTGALREFLQLEPEWLTNVTTPRLERETFSRFVETYGRAPATQVMNLRRQLRALYAARGLMPYDIEVSWYVFVRYLALHEWLREIVGQHPAFRAEDERFQQEFLAPFVGRLQQDLAEGKLTQARPKLFFQDRLLALGNVHPRFRRYGTLLTQWDEHAAEEARWREGHEARTPVSGPPLFSGDSEDAGGGRGICRAPTMGTCQSSGGWRCHPGHPCRGGV